MMGNLIQSIWLLYGDARPSDIQEMVFRNFFLHLILIYLNGHVKTVFPSEKKNDQVLSSLHYKTRQLSLL